MILAARFQAGGRGVAGWNYRSVGDGHPKVPASLSHKETDHALKIEQMIFAHEKKAA